MENIIVVKNSIKFDLPIKKVSTFLFIILSSLPIVNIVFISYWLKEVFKVLNIKGYEFILMIWLILNIIVYLEAFSILNFAPYSNGIMWLFYGCTSYVIIKKILKYAKLNYNLAIKYNPFAFIFFTILYINFIINTFTERCKKAFILKELEKRMD